MNTITIYEGQRGLRYLDGKLTGVLAPGRYRDWAWLGKLEIRAIDVRQVVLDATVELERVLPANEADVLEVAEDQLALVTRAGRPLRALEAGRYVIWRSEGEVDIELVALGSLRTAIPVAFWPLVGARLVTEVLVRPYERVIVYDDGVLVEVLGAGRYGLGAWQRKLELVRFDLREQELQVVGQELITADKASLRLNLLLKFVVVDPVAVTGAVTELRDALYAEVQMAARQAVAGVSVDALLERRVELARELVAAVGDRAKPWGIEIRKLEIKDVVLPGELKELMNRVIEADKRAAAQMILRREEVAATRALANTARLLESNPVLLRLKETEAVKEIAEKIANLTVVMAPKDLQDILRLGAS